MRISVIQSKRDNMPAGVEVTWDELVQSFAEPRRTACTVATCAHSECASKDGPAWLPAEWPTGAPRGLAYLTAVHAFVVDYDHVKDEDLPQALAPLRQFRAVVHSSHSDRPGDRCVRAVVALDRAVPAEDWPRFREHAIDVLGLPREERKQGVVVSGGSDDTTKDGSRLYFTPSRPADADYHYESWDGPPIPVAQVLAGADARGRSRAAPREAVARELPAWTSAPLPEAQERAALALAQAWPVSGRHRAQLALSGALARAGWPVEHVADFVASVCAVAARLSGIGDVHGDYGKRLNSARASVDKVRAGIDVAGWPSVIAAIGDSDAARRAVSTACGALGFGSAVEAREFADLMAARAQKIAPAFTPEFTAPVQETPVEVSTNRLAQLQPEAKHVEPPPGFTAIAVLLSDAAARPKIPSEVISTGWPELDELMGGGLWTRRLCVIAGAPGSGKSAWVLDRVMDIEGRATSGRPALYVSTELEDDELACRAAAPILRVPWSQLLLAQTDMGVSAALRGRRIRCIGCDRLPDTTEAVIALIGNAVIEMTAEHGVAPVVVVDYIQQVVRGEDPRNLRSAVGTVTKALRSLAQQGSCAVLGVLSVSRAFYGANAAKLRESDDPEAYLGAAKESGDVEYDAAQVLFIDLDKSTKQPVLPGRIVVAKSRHGQAGFAGGRFAGALGTWTGDPSALIEMRPDAKRERKKSEQDDADEETVLRFVRSADEQGRVLLKNELVTGCGIQHQRARDALTRLSDAGQLEEVGARGMTDRRGRMFPAKAVVLRAVADDARDHLAEPPSPINTASIAGRMLVQRIGDRP